jgi:hypothetical protein
MLGTDGMWGNVTKRLRSRICAELEFRGSRTLRWFEEERRKDGMMRGDLR